MKTQSIKNKLTIRWSHNMEFILWNNICVNITNYDTATKFHVASRFMGGRGWNMSETGTGEIYNNLEHSGQELICSPCWHHVMLHVLIALSCSQSEGKAMITWSAHIGHVIRLAIALTRYFTFPSYFSIFSSHPAVSSYWTFNNNIRHFVIW